MQTKYSVFIYHEQNRREVTWHFDNRFGDALFSSFADIIYKNDSKSKKQ